MIKKIKHFNTTHGMSYSPEHAAWAGMKSRCYNKKARSFSVYGERGITVCQKWLHSFESFMKDMGPRPSKKHSIDRIDNDGDYCPENCRWATSQTQNTNRSTLKSNTSGYTGVYKNWNKWGVRVRFNGKRVYIGNFHCKYEAAMACDMFKEKNNLPPYKKD